MLATEKESTPSKTNNASIDDHDSDDEEGDLDYNIDFEGKQIIYIYKPFKDF